MPADAARAAPIALPVTRIGPRTAIPVAVIIHAAGGQGERRRGGAAEEQEAMTLAQFLVIFFGPAAVLAVCGLVIWASGPRPAGRGSNDGR